MSQCKRPDGLRGTRAFSAARQYPLRHWDTVDSDTWRRITTLAADRGNQDAQLLLGQTYMEGLPELPRDPVQNGM